MDYAFVVLNQNVSAYTGSYSFLMNSGSPSAVYHTGYPGTGKFQAWCQGNSCFQWYCWSPHHGYAGYPDVPGWYEIAINCETGQGMSGGPMFESVNGASYVSSNFSNGPFYSNGEFYTAWGPYYNDYVQSHHSITTR